MGIRSFGFNEDGCAVYSYQQGALLIRLKDANRSIKFAPQTDGFNLTPSGHQLISLLPEGTAVSIREISENYRKNEFLGEIQCGKIKEDGEERTFVPDEGEN